MDLSEEIARLKRSKRAVLLVHNYQKPEIQDVADFLGDSLGLAGEAAKTDAEMIVFCGVMFMAETAKILSPQKVVVLPRKEAGCPMADMITVPELKALKARYPDAKVVSYVNTNADVKAESDVCCTSANAVEVVKNIDSERVIFTPDRNLAAYCQRFVEKEIIPWSGYCYVHERITSADILAARKEVPDALVLVHPECRPEVIDAADEVLSTSGMVDFARESGASKFIIGTEEGLLYRLKRENPGKEFYTAGTAKVCQNMKRTSLKDVYLALQQGQHRIELSEDTMVRARQALDAMLQHLPSDRAE